MASDAAGVRLTSKYGFWWINDTAPTRPRTSTAGNKMDKDWLYDTALGYLVYLALLIINAGF